MKETSLSSVDAFIKVDVIRATPFNAVKRIMGYYFDGFRDARGWK